MQRTTQPIQQKISSDGKKLVALAKEMFCASSFTESEFARFRLQVLVAALIEKAHQKTLNEAGEYLFGTDMEAYNCLLEVIESYCESAIVIEQGRRYLFLLVAVPILAWTRYTIPSGRLEDRIYQKLAENFRQIMLAENVRMKMSPILFTVDQLPMEHIEVFKASRKFIDSIQTGEPCIIPTKTENMQFMADGRYLLVGLMAEEGQPLFRWQADADPTEIESRKEACMQHWKQVAMPLMLQVLPGCNLDFLQPGGLFNTCRKTDQEIRPATVMAAVQYLENALNVPAQSLGAVIGGFGKESSGSQVEEYRISFYQPGDSKIVYGVVWPIFGVEEINGLSMPVLLENHPDALNTKGGKQLLEIFHLLRQLNIHFEKHPVDRFITEYCDDCGQPLFVDTNGELAHAEMPEETQQDIRLH